MFSLAVLTFLINVSMLVSKPGPIGSVPMKIKNHAGAPIEVFWVNVFSNNELVKQSEKPIRNSSDTSINSYDGHEFVVNFFKGNSIERGGFVKGPKEETVLVEYDRKTGFKISQRTKFDEMKDNIRKATDECEGQSGDLFAECVAKILNDDVEKLQDSKDELAKYRDLVSSRVRNYTCADLSLNTSEPLRSQKMSIGQKSFTVETLFDSSHARIWSVKNFITPEECSYFEAYGKSRLRRATVAAEDGTSTISIHRKAQQAGYDLQSRPKDPLWDLYHRVLHLTNSYTGFKLQPEGQEDFTIIQYDVGDEYTPHCDGSCDHTKHNAGGRVATAVMYCKIAEKGGGTSFSKADVFVKPEVGMATFFSYRGLDGLMDPGYTEHSGCPVLEGDKWITTFWMRDGVSRENPWTVYDPSGIPIFDSAAEGGMSEVEVDADS